MALKLNERYPQRWDSPSNDYPQGAFKNLAELGEQDGSYLEKDWLNDYSGFFGALLKNAQMTPDGTVDTAQKSQFYDALVTVAKSVVGEEGYRKLDDNVFNGLMTIKSDNEGQGAGAFLQDTDGTVRGQFVATDQGLRLAQYPEGGGTQTFTFPSEGGEIATTSYVDAQIAAIPEVDTSNLVSKDDITNELGDSTELVASQALVSSHGLGYGQSWVDVTSQRSANTTYINETNKPIMVSATEDVTASEGWRELYVDNTNIGSCWIGTAYRDTSMMSFIVPPGSSYKITGITIENWAELR